MPHYSTNFDKSIFCIFVFFFPDFFSVCVVSVPVGPYLDVLCRFCTITAICRSSLRPKSGVIWRCFGRPRWAVPRCSLYFSHLLTKNVFCFNLIFLCDPKKNFPKENCDLFCISFDPEMSQLVAA